MKKRTVITTEKREVWVISEGSLKREIGDQPQDDMPGPGSESLVTTNQDDSDESSYGEQEKENE